jgi:hypothetical protein
MPTVTLSPGPTPTIRSFDRTRDEFAMAALTGLLAANVDYDTLPEQAAARAFTIADAMLKQREAS